MPEHLKKITAALFSTILCTIYLSFFIFKGWIPHDDGMLAHMAERLLNGEKAHVDFQEVYSGGLTYIHALAFKYLGVNLRSLRITLFIFFLPFCFVFNLVLSRFTKPLTSCFLTLIAVAWSVANYPASVPSWYNLFFAIFALYFFILHIETNKRLLLLLAGIMCGFSISIKIIGIFTYLAGLFCIIYITNVFTTKNKNSKTKLDYAAFILLFLGILGANVCIISLLHSKLNIEVLYHLLLPALFVSCIVLNQISKSIVGLRKTLLVIVLNISIFTLGTVIGVTPLLINYTSIQELVALYQGIFITPKTRLLVASSPFPDFSTVLFCLPVLVMLFCLANTKFTQYFNKIRISGVIALTLICVLYQEIALDVIWFSIRNLAPLLILIFLPIVIQKNPEKFTIISFLAFFGFIQYPYSSNGYFLYLSPILFISLISYLHAYSFPYRKTWLALLAFYTLIIAGINNPVIKDNLQNLSLNNQASTHRSLLNQRGGISIQAYYNSMYDDIVNFIQSHTSENSYILAIPDAPEVYFLSNRKNPSKEIYNFLSEDSLNTETIINYIKVFNIQIVVLKAATEFSNITNQPDLILKLEELYPLSDTIGRFTVFYKKN